MKFKNGPGSNRGGGGNSLVQAAQDAARAAQAAAQAALATTKAATAAAASTSATATAAAQTAASAGQVAKAATPAGPTWAAGKTPTTPTGGVLGNFLLAGASRDQLILDAMRHKNFAASGLAPTTLTQMTDQQLFDLRKGLGTATPTRPAATTIAGKMMEGVRAGGVGLAQKAGVGKFGGWAQAAQMVVESLPAIVDGVHESNLMDEMGGDAGSEGAGVRQ